MSQIPVKASGKREVVNDILTGILMLATVGLLAFAHFGQTGRLHQDYGAEPGPAFLPELLLHTLALTGAALILRGAYGARQHRMTLGSFDAVGVLRQSKTALMVAATLVAFLLLRPVSGFGIAAVALGSVIAVILARQEGHALLRAASEGALIATSLYWLFRLALSVPLT